MEEIIYVFGNGNLSFESFKVYYERPIMQLLLKNKNFIVCDFKGVDTLTMELLKCITANVTVLHIGEKPRYIPDKYKTEVSKWHIIGGFQSDKERDNVAINMCTHFLACDLNTNKKRKSGTQANIEDCLNKHKISILLF
ncbi:hypothetical protein IUY40_00145 [Flavobacterium sp. ALJ2]|uniref:hypothetical protein n=1 Tax=Flavobacterium sp. ALJ2 TaxID=2786960 RepID=UPI00189F1CED|nr:hypothetical protein [Flavobacterium sp. ALJ2]MBF7089959.1 hypothetical protein [Flavobacterium sp. ALJ2]